jgi:hypothetical protein
VDGARGDVDHMQGRPEQFSTLKGHIRKVNAIAQDTGSAYNVWQPLLERVNMVVEVVDAISEVIYIRLSDSSLFLTLSDQMHPYVRMAWSVLSLPVDVSSCGKQMIVRGKTDFKYRM